MKKNKLLATLLVVTTFFSNLAGVSAKTITINEVDTSVKKVFKEGYNVDMTTIIDTVNKTYSITGTTMEQAAKFTYTDDYIEYIDNTPTLDDSSVAKGIGAMLVVAGVMQAIIEATGHKTKTFKSDLDMNTFKSEETWATYGIYVVSEKYENTTTNENGTSHVSVDYIRHFRMSFDSTKIDKLIAKYGTDKATQTSTTTQTDTKTEQQKNVTKEDKALENPDTGAFISVPLLASLLSICFVVIMLSRRFSSFKRL